jgi:hypothetical protein
LEIENMRGTALLALVVVAFACATAANAANVNVHDFGAVGDDVTDDTAAIQAAIDAVAAQGGGTVWFPLGAYLLDSYNPSPHPWYFYNLIVPSNITLDADPGTSIIQGCAGRAPVLPGAYEVATNMLVVGTPLFDVVTFQVPSLNGGFYNLNATVAGSSVVNLTTAADAAHFNAGDYVAFYDAAHLQNDVIPAETSQVVAVDPATGALTLAHRVARSFPTSVIANVTSRATAHVGIHNLILQGSIPLTLMELFDFNVSNCKFITDTSIGGSNIVTGLNANTVRGMRMDNCVFDTVGPTLNGLELPQRDSQDISINNVTFNVKATGFGEYGAHWKITNCHFTTHVDATVNNPGFGVAGLDVEFSGNTVTNVGNINSSSSWGSLFYELNGVFSLQNYFGQIRILNNTFNCRTDGNNCIVLSSADPIVSGNTLNLTGSGTGIHLEGIVGEAAVITDNHINVDTGTGILLYTNPIDGTVIANNSITASNGSIGIFVPSPGTPNSGGHLIQDNIVSGFTMPVSIDLSEHPGTIIINTPKNSNSLLTLSATPNTAGIGDALTVTWSGAASGSVGDAIALYQSGALDANFSVRQSTGGAASGTLTFTAPLSAGSYEFRYLHGPRNISFAASNAITVSVLAPVITTQPANQTVDPDQPASFSVTAIGSAPLSYQWEENGQPISGAVNPSYQLGAVTAALNGTTFRCVVSNSAGSATSADAVLTVNNAVVPAPVIASSLNVTATVGSAFNYTIVASNTPTQFDASGLPAGLSLDPASGIISGTPTMAGTSNVTLSASNAGGTGTAVLSLSIYSVAQTLHVSAIAISLSKTTAGKAAVVTVTVKNGKGIAVTGAVVSGTWSGLTSSDVSAKTATGGKAKFTSARTKQSGQFAFNVTGISKPGFGYDASQNSVSGASITTGGVKALLH